MSDVEQARQDDQIEKLWDAAKENRTAIDRHHAELLEVRATLIGIDGTNGIRRRVYEIADDIEEIRETISKGHLSCPIAKQVGEHMADHKTKESGIWTARRFYIGQLITIAIFVAGMLLKR